MSCYCCFHALGTIIEVCPYLEPCADTAAMEFTGVWCAPQPVIKRVGSGVYLTADFVYDAISDSCWCSPACTGQTIRGGVLSSHSFIVDGCVLTWIYYNLTGNTVSAQNIELTIPMLDDREINIKRVSIVHIEIISDTECEMYVEQWIFRLRVTDTNIRHGIYEYDGRLNMKWA